MALKKWTLMVISIFLVIMGIMGALPNLDMGAEPFGHAIAKIVVGVVGIVIAQKR